jgi:D-glycero-alpha-D-manno-heptose-7-phosphate kinase
MNGLHNILLHHPVEASAPCRIDMGGTLDLSTFYLALRHAQPCTFNLALDLRTRVRLTPHTQGKIKVSSTGFDPVEVDSRRIPFGPPLGLMLAVAASFNADGIHMEIESASPPRSALGGSSVAAVALIWAFSKALRHQGVPMPDRKAVALRAQAVEQSIAGVPCGLQDQLAAAFGGVNGWYWSVDFTGQAFSRRRLLDASAYRDFQRCLLVAYCGVPHVSKDVNSTWVDQFICGSSRQQWDRIVACSRQFIEAGGTGDHGLAVRMMNEETDIRRELTPDVLDDMGDALVAAARTHDCGARFTGAGGGGCIWALGGREKIDALRPEWQRLLDKRQGAALLNAGIAASGVL